MNKKIFVPVVVTVVLAAALYGVAVGLLPVTNENRQADLNSSHTTLLSGSETFTVEPYSGEDANISAVYKADNGYVVETVTDGYVDEITLLVGVSNDGKVTGVVVRDQHETWGLGQKAANDVPFLTQLLLDKETLTVGENVDGVTGATVTSKAVVKAVNSAKAFVTGADVSSSATEWGG